MLKKLFFLNVVLLCWQVVAVHAQSVNPNVISSAGSTASGGSSIINYNVGEPIIGTLTGGSYQITQGFEQPGGINSTLLTGLVSYWNLDETSGTTAYDVAGGGNNGTNTADTLGRTGKIKTAYGFDTTSAGLLIPNAPNLNLTSSGTISVWVNLHNSAFDSGQLIGNYFHYIISKGKNDSAGYNLYYTRYYNTFTGQLATSPGTLTYFNFAKPASVVPGKWYHLVVTWGNGFVTTYMNGIPTSPVALNGNPSITTSNFGIGYAPYPKINIGYFDGRIDEVGLWNRAITGKEDSLLYAAGYGNPYPFDGSGNVPPTANAGANQTLPTNTTSATLNGSGTGTAITYAWTKISGGSATITSPTSAITTITGLSAGAYSFQLTVTDNLGNTAQSIVKDTVSPAPLTANAGKNQILVAGTTSTTLYGSGTGSGITYAWTQTAGASASITSLTSATTGITGLTTGTYTFQLTVTDVLNNTATSSVNVTILSNTSGSSLLNGLISYWNLNDSSGLAIDNAGGGNNGTNSRVRQGVAGKMNTAYLYPGSPAGTLMTNAPNLSFTTAGSISAWVQIPLVSTGATYPGVPGGYYFGSIVNKENNSKDSAGYCIYYDSYYNVFTGELASATSNQAINFTGVNITANTWIHLVVTWDGTNLTTYMNGSNVNIVPQTVIPLSNVYPFAIGYQAADNSKYFKGSIDEVGAWSRALTAQEVASLYGAGAGNPYPFIGPLPVANAGPNQTLPQGTTTTTLNGSGSTGTRITYSWTQTGGPGVATIASPAQAISTISGLATGTYTFQLTVTDSLNNMATSSVNITVGSPPTAYAGTNRTLISGTTSTKLYGSGTGSNITYHWTKTAGANATITSPNLASTAITGLTIGTYTFQLTVTDASNNTASSSVNVSIIDTTGNHLLNGLISYWNLDDSTGLALDDAGGGNDGTNAADTLHVPGLINTGYGFNGTTSKIDMTNAANLSLTTAGTISAWVYMPNLTLAHDGLVVGKGNWSTDLNGYLIVYTKDSKTFTAELANGTTHQSISFLGVTIAPNTWYHLVLTWNGTRITTYLNGDSSSIAQTVIPVSNVSAFAIGYQAITNSLYFNGRIDEVGIWNKALSASQVASLYSGNFGYPYPFVNYNGSTPVGVTSVPSQPLVTNDVITSVTAYPNPYSAQIHFNMKSSISGKASLTLYDLLGRKVATVFEGDLTAGYDKTVSYQTNFGKRQPLIYIFTIGDKIITGKLIPGEY